MWVKSINSRWESVLLVIANMTLWMKATLASAELYAALVKVG
ncbi:hypothetical protein OKW24_004080 [Peribacillus simplex]|nr:hypothetical protein [Peribacillus simplex]SNT49895.1 hypothetical protein SAMN05444672_13434 [Bacillus sp. OK838]